MFEKIILKEKMELMKKSIEELRIVCNGLGISSYAVLTKKELVAKIIECYLGNGERLGTKIEKPSPKREFSYDFTKPLTYQSYSVCASRKSDYEIESLIKTGIVVIDENKVKLIDCDFELSTMSSKLSNDIFDGYNVKTGDIVNYTIKNDELTIVSVNGCANKVVDGAKYADAEIVKPSKKYLVNSMVDAVAPICKGSRTMIAGSAVACQKYANRVVYELGEKNPNALVYGVQINDNMGSLKLKNVVDHMIAFKSEDGEGDIKNKLTLFSEFIKRYIELGSDLVVYIPTFNGKDFDSYVVETLIDFAGSYTTGASITFVISTSTVNLLYKYAPKLTNVMVLDVLYNTTIIDAKRSVTLFLDAILTAQEFKFLNELKLKWDDLHDVEKVAIFRK